MGSLEQNTTLVYGVHIRESANDGSDFSNGATDYRVLFLGEDGLLHVKDSAGAVTSPYNAGLGAWTDYTPTWTATTTNPTLGSTTIIGRYKEVDSTTLIVQVNIAITTGGAWNAGSGDYHFSLPGGYTAASEMIQTGSAYILDSGTTFFPAVCRVASGGTTISEVFVADAAGFKILAHNVPITWATGDQINLDILIETT